MTATTVEGRDSGVFAALGHPVRLRMAEALLRSGPLALSDLARPFAMTLTGAKKHVAVLEAAGVLTCRKQGRENICAINPPALEDAAGWFERHEKFWTGSLDRLDQLLRRKPS